MATTGYLLSAVCVITALVLLVLAMRTVPAGHAGVIERLGRRHSVVPAGRLWLLPVLDRLILVDLAPRRFEVAPVSVVTADGAAIAVRAEIDARVVDAGAAVYYGAPEIERVAHAAIAATLASVARSEALTGRGALSARLRDQLSGGIAGWGYQLTQVSLEFAATPEGFDRR